MKTYRISGRVIDHKTQKGLTRVRVEAWDKDLIFSDLVGCAFTNQDGAFKITFDESHFHELFENRQPDLFFKVFYKTVLIASTENSVLWNIATEYIEVIIQAKLIQEITMPDCTNIENQITEKQNQIDTLEEFCPLLQGGRERAQCFAQLRNRREELRRLEEALRSCQAGLPPAGIQQTQGRVTFLRVSELGDAFGPRGDSIEAEVVFKLDTQPGRAFGFRLEDDENRPVREGMLSSLRESLINRLNVVINYDQKTGDFNSITKRVALKAAESSTFEFPRFSAET